MRMPPIFRPAVRLDARSLKLRIGRSFATASKRRARTHGQHTELPRKIWDRIVLLMFTCCLFTFLHALLGFGVVDEEQGALNDTSELPRATLPIPSPWSWGLSADQEMRGLSGVTRVTVDWQGDYELLQSATSALVSPALAPQNAFLDPTPTRGGARRRRAADKNSPTKTTHVNIPFSFYGAPYDPFRLEFEDSVNAGETHPIAEPPPQRSARARRFGRCLPREACL